MSLLNDVMEQPISSRVIQAEREGGGEEEKSEHEEEIVGELRMCIMDVVASCMQMRTLCLDASVAAYAYACTHALFLPCRTVHRHALLIHP